MAAVRKFVDESVAWLAGAAAFMLVLAVVSWNYSRPKETRLHEATVTGTYYDSGGPDQAASWYVELDVPGVGDKRADAHSFYDLVDRTGVRPRVVIGLRGGHVTEIRYQGRSYDTSFASSRSQLITAIVCAAIALLLAAASAVGWRRQRRLPIASGA